MDRFKTLLIEGWWPAIHGMRAPLKSYGKIDSKIELIDPEYRPGIGRFIIGPNDYKLAKSLCQAGPEHRKWMRQIQVWVKISQPLMWWSEFDTYKIGTAANSESTMHTITKKKLLQQDFDIQYLSLAGQEELLNIVSMLNLYIDRYQSETKTAKEKEDLFLLIKSLLPASFIQTRYVNLNYEVLRNMYHQRKNHRLPQWSIDFVSWIETLPYSEFITDNWEK